MNKYILSNSIKVIEVKRQTETVTIQITITIGSNNEEEGIRGVSHFIEHMLFEGTKNRKNAKEISNEIESLGGELNAYTDNTRTCFYIKVPKQHFEKAVEILSDILKNPIFRNEDIEKERGVILKEINIFNDEPRYLGWMLFCKNLFIKHPSKFPAYGTRKDVHKIMHNNIVHYFETNYIAENCIISIVGNFKDSKNILKKYFLDMRRGIKIINKKIDEPRQKIKKIVKTKKKVLNSYFVLGYKTIPRIAKDSYVLDVIEALLGKGQSGKMFDEIRNKRGLAYEVGIINETNINFGIFAIYLSADKKNISQITQIVLNELKKLRNVTNNELNDAIGFIEGRYILDKEDSHNSADELAFWELIKDARLEEDYLKKIRNVTKKDIAKVAKKYFSEKYTLSIVEQN